MADFQHRRDRGIVRFSGELKLSAAVDLVETIDMLHRVYFYDLIELQISSRGGVSTALDHYLAAHERWRAAGVRVRTRVVDRAASAAALLLSLGDERIAEPGAALVYHCFRVCSDAPVTATAAAVLFSDLADLDDRFLARLVDRALAGGVATIAPAVDASDLPVLDRLTGAFPAGAKPRPRSARGLARLLERAVRRAIRAKDRTAFLRPSTRRFAAARWRSPRPSPASFASLTPSATLSLRARMRRAPQGSPFRTGRRCTRRRARSRVQSSRVTRWRLATRGRARASRRCSPSCERSRMRLRGASDAPCSSIRRARLARSFSATPRSGCGASRPRSRGSIS